MCSEDSNEQTACVIYQHHPQIIKIGSALVQFMQINWNKPLDLLEKESMSVLNPKPEPLPKPPPPPPDMLISLKLLSSLPEPIDCIDIDPNPPLSPLPFSICRIYNKNSNNGWLNTRGNRQKIRTEAITGLWNIPCFCQSH